MKALQLRVPSSKSVTHRALLLAARSEVPCIVQSPLLGEDCRSTLSVLQKLGARFEERGADIHFEPIQGWRAPTETLDCGNSGTTLRLFTGQVATIDGASTLDGDASLRRRPNGALLDALGVLGVTVEGSGRAPFTVRGRLKAGEVRVPSGSSSQYGSSLILATALADVDSTRISMPKPVASRPYLQLTMEVAAEFGIYVDVIEGPQSLVFDVPGRQVPRNPRFEVEGDWSGAAFPLVAAATLGKDLALSGLRPDSSQGDACIVELLARFGPRVHWRGSELCLEPGPLRGAREVDLSAAPDLFCALVALAAVAEGETTFVNTPSLRLKECDRIAVMAEGLRQLGVSVHERSDGLKIIGGPLKRGLSLQSHEDHRVHMAFAILAGLGAGISVDHRGCEAVSYPNFYDDLERLGA